MLFNWLKSQNAQQNVQVIQFEQDIQNINNVQEDIIENKYDDEEKIVVELESECNGNDSNNYQNKIKCIKCNNWYKSVYKKNQQEYINYTCNNCNEGKGDENKFKCKYCEDKSWLTPKGFIAHFSDENEK